MKKVFLVFPVLLVLCTTAFATRWYEVEDDHEAVKTEPKIEHKTPKPEKETPPPGDRVLKPVATWMYTYGGRGEDTSRSLASADDGYILSGLTRSFGAGAGDAWFIRTDVDGKALWDKTYGTSLEEAANGIAASDTGGWCVAGQDTTTKFLALKLGEDGNVNWNKKFGGSLPANGIGVDYAPGGGCVVAGYFSRNPGDECDGYAWISELDSHGEEVWKWNDAPNCTSWMRAVKRTPFGTHIAAGERFNGNEHIKYWILKLDENRFVSWEIEAATKNFRIFNVKSLIAADNGSFLVFGSAKVSFDRTDQYGWMIKVDAAGNVEWEQHYINPNDPDVINSVIQIEGGGFVGVGFKQMPSGKYNGSIMETDPHGTIKWHKTYGGAGSEAFTGVIPAIEGDGYVVSGVTSSKGAGGYDFLIMKTDRRGICKSCNF